LSANGQLRFDVDTTEFLIGKSRERVQGVISGNNAISRVHCKIMKRDNSYYIVDMGSSNGTFVDGKRINSDIPELIHDGSRIRLANEDFIVRG
jgi:pSer/pThr/pTyr-binding forkhead associated (FHA) protein